MGKAGGRILQLVEGVEVTSLADISDDAHIFGNTDPDAMVIDNLGYILGNEDYYPNPNTVWEFDPSR